MSRFECEKCGYKTDQKSNFDRHVKTWMNRDCAKKEKFKPKTFEKSFASHSKSVYWHPTMNGDTKPRDVFISTADKFWFKCDKCPHNFEASLCHINNGTWCPYCSPTSKILCKDLECQFCHENSFASCEKSKYWHPTMNDKLKPRDFLKRCDTRAWFKCHSCAHDFEGQLKHVTKGVWCPYCSKPRKKICENSKCQMCFNDSFASELGAKVWHPTKNKPVTPRNVTKGSDTKKYWFQCTTCLHDYENIVTATRGNTLGCPYCSNQMRCKDANCRICFKNSFASNPNSIHWHPTKNRRITPRDVAKRTHEEFWFKCIDCHHESKKPICHVRVDQKDEEGWGCSYCSKTHRKLCDDAECQFCHENSFASHPKSIHWHPTMNDDLKPRYVTRCNDLKAWFKCDKCPHKFEATISHITNGTWCPYCVEPVKKICKDKTCHHCLLKSFASHPRSDQWHPTKNKPVTPRDVARSSSSEKYWFKCDKCPHDFKATPSHITTGTWCPYCRGNELCDATSCDFCFKKSFASHPKAIHWHPSMNGDLKPRDICMGANRKAWFNCDICSNHFDTSVNHVSGRGGWCGICKNKTEKKVYDYLINHYPNLERELRVDWCKNPETNCYYPFDFCIKEKCVIIELDGRQHFEDVKYWKSSFEDRHAVDLIKQVDANKNGFRVIRLIQEDVWSDKYDWLTELLKNIEDDTKQNVFMCKNGEYNFFIESMNFITSEGQHPPCSTSSP